METVQPSQKTSKLDDLWSTLEDALKKIYAREPLDPLRYYELFELANSYILYDIFAAGRGSDSERDLSNRLNRITRAGRENHSGRDLSHRLNAFLRNFVESIYEQCREKTGESLLSFYSSNWDAYRSSSRIIRGIFINLTIDRIDPDIAYGADNKGVLRVYTLPMIIWKECLLKRLHHSLTNNVLKLTECEDTGDETNAKLIGGIAQRYRELDTDVPNGLRVYNEYLEKPFLQRFEACFVREFEERVTVDTFTEHMEKMQRRIREEEVRCERYLQESKRDQLEEILERVCFIKRLESLNMRQ